MDICPVKQIGRERDRLLLVSISTLVEWECLPTPNIATIDVANGLVHEAKDNSVLYLNRELCPDIDANALVVPKKEDIRPLKDEMKDLPDYHKYQVVHQLAQLLSFFLANNVLLAFTPDSLYITPTIRIFVDLQKCIIRRTPDSKVSVKSNSVETPEGNRWSEKGVVYLFSQMVLNLMTNRPLDINYLTESRKSSDNQLLWCTISEKLPTVQEYEFLYIFIPGLNRDPNVRPGIDEILNNLLLFVGVDAIILSPGSIKYPTRHNYQIPITYLQLIEAVQQNPAIYQTQLALLATLFATIDFYNRSVVFFELLNEFDPNLLWHISVSVMVQLFPDGELNLPIGSYRIRADETRIDYLRRTIIAAQDGIIFSPYLFDICENWSDVKEAWKWVKDPRYLFIIDKLWKATLPKLPPDHDIKYMTLAAWYRTI